MTEEEGRLLAFYQEIEEKTTVHYYGFVKLLVSTSIAVMAGMIGFFKPAEGLYFVIVYCVVLVSLALGVLSSAIVLYGQVATLKLHQDDLRKYINVFLQQKRSSGEMIQTARPSIYTLWEKISFVSYIIFILSLLMYGLSIPIYAQIYN